MRPLLSMPALLAVLSTHAVVSSAATVSTAFDDFGGATITAASTFVALALLFLGLVLTFAGRRFLRESVFVGALIGGGFAMASGVIDAVLTPDSDALFSFSSADMASPALAALASWTGFFTCGCVIAAATSGSHQRVAYALIGGFMGVVLAFIIHLAWDHFVLLAVVLGVALGMGASAWEAPPAAVVIVPTSVAGAALVLLGVAFFTGGFPTTYDLVKFWATAQLRDSWFDAVPGSWWGFFAAFVVLVLLGAVTQFVTERLRGESRPETDSDGAKGEEEDVDPSARSEGKVLGEDVKAERY